MSGSAAQIWVRMHVCASSLPLSLSPSLLSLSPYLSISRINLPCLTSLSLSLTHASLSLTLSHSLFFIISTNCVDQYLRRQFGVYHHVCQSCLPKIFLTYWHSCPFLSGALCCWCHVSYSSPYPFFRSTSSLVPLCLLLPSGVNPSKYGGEWLIPPRTINLCIGSRYIC